MKFYSRSNLPPRRSSPCGSCYEDEYGYQKDKLTGRFELVKTGQVNTFEKIQAVKTGCTLYERLTLFNNGDVNALNVVEGQYADLTSLPKTLAEAQQQIIDSRKLFDNLPLEERRLFGFSFDRFVTAVSSGEYQKSLEERYAKKIKDLSTKVPVPGSEHSDAGIAQVPEDSKKEDKK